MRKNPWKETVAVRLPRAERGAEEYRFVGVNGRYFQVPRGRLTQVPRPVYDVLTDAIAGEEEAERYIETILNRPQSGGTT